MKSLFGLFVILISLLFNLKSAIAFDYAPEIGDLAPSFNLEGINKSIKSKKIWDSNAEIIGISADNQDSHDSFCSEKSINYTLLSDPNGTISAKYGSWIPPYSDRNTFLISPEGKITYRWISVLPINHAKEVLNILKKNI